LLIILALAYFALVRPLLRKIPTNAQLVVGAVLLVLGLAIFFERTFLARELFGATVVGDFGWNERDLAVLHVMAGAGAFLFLLGALIAIGAALAISATDPVDSDPLSTKECPFCAESIKAAAKVCRFCGREIS
jgi:hypothetical protein